MKTNKYIPFCLFLLYLAPAKAIDIPKDDCHQQYCER